MLSFERGVTFAERLIKRAKDHGATISFDVNFRSDIFKDEKEAVKIYKRILPLADILKFSEDEIEVFGEDYIKSALKGKLVFVTLGAKGSRWTYKGRNGFAPTVKVNCVDTTGAGDAFYAGVLTKLDKKDLKSLTDGELDGILRYANVCGALNTRGRGAIDHLPSAEEIEKVLNGQLA